MSDISNTLPNTLYHVSTDTAFIKRYFLPRIPFNTMEEEDTTTERICTSSSIEGCFSSAPWGGVRLEDTMAGIEDDMSYPEEAPEGVWFRVYEFDITSYDKCDVVTPIELYESGKVRDAFYKDEYWLLEYIEPSKTYLIYVTYWEEEYEDLLTFEQQKKLEETDLDYNEIWDGSTTTIITKLDYSVKEDSCV